MATDFLNDVSPLVPLHIAPVADAPFADCFHTPPETLSAIAGYVSDNVNDAREAVEKADNYLSLGAAYFRADDLVFVVEARTEAKRALYALEPLDTAMTFGKPRSWYEARRELLQSRLDILRAQRPENYGAITVSELLESLIEA